MPKKQKSISLFYTLAVSVITLSTVILRTVALLTAYEADIGFYASADLSIAGASLFAASGIAIAFFAYQMREHFAFSPDYRDLPSLISGIFFAISLLFFGITLVIGAIAASTATLLIAILNALFAFAGAAIFVLRAFDGRVGSALAAILTLPTAALGILFALYLGSEGAVMLTAPAKLLATAAWIASAFFFLGEARIALGRAKWALHLSVTAMTVILSGALSLPNLIYHAVYGAPLLFNTAHDFAAFGLFLYAAARLAAILVSPVVKGENPPLVSEEEQNEEASGR